MQYVQPNARTLIVGDGPLRERLEAASHAYRLDDHVQFLGHREDVPRLMATADLVVLPSAYEGLPNVVLEAMRFRKPVVATAAPGTTEVVANGQTGLLVPIGNPPLLARAIRDVIRDSALASRLGEAGHSRVEAHFRAETMVAQFAELYERLAKVKGITG
jgi:glycosyltransferase involved in cell wall biosynthesis